jgi:polar amino acid transport system permease protein
MTLDRTLSIFWEFRWLFVEGLTLTIALTLASIVIALITGVIAALGTLARLRAIRWLFVCIVEFCRNTPMLVLLVWVHYALPEMTGIKTTAIVSSVIALVMQSTGYLAEEYRGGIESIDKGQFEAAKSLGMTYGRLMRRIILPQAIARMMPGIINQFVLCFKSTSVVSVIAVPDLMYHANVIVNETFLTMQTYTIVALTYFLIIFAFSMAVQVFSRRISYLGPNQAILQQSI